MNTNKFFGSIMILIGTTIGVGMLALPTYCGAAGFAFSSVVMLLLWALSIATGLMIVEVNLAFPTHACTFNTMAEQLLGPIGKAVTWISYLFLLYSVTTVYIAGESSIIAATLEPVLNTKIPGWVNATAFTLILGMAVFWSTKTVDYFNRGLFSLKGVLLLITIALIMPHIDISKLNASQHIEQTRYLWVAAPIFLAAFGNQFVIPSIRIYIGAKPKELKWVVVLGATGSLIIYFLWLAVTLGTVPLTGDNSFTSWAQNYPGSMGEFIKTVTNTLDNKWITSSINSFYNIAMTTSFLGVTLSLFDFLADGFKRPDTRSGRLQTAGLTFIPPLFFALLFPESFSKALTFAVVFLSVLVVILPAMMIYKLRKDPNLKSSYRMFGGNLLLAATILIGAAIVVLCIMSNLNLLPNIGL
ncbi:MAG: hypothetical protein ACD_21C00172G0001 [uncultured bacterium]|nr:MAG: hypothetical protein ACD_21C00172G0001 [uncultured bacterium]